MSTFTQIYQQYGPPVYRFLLSLTCDAHLAEELLQETFYQAFLHIDRFEGRSSLYTWLCTIGKNAWLRETRRRDRFADSSLDDLALTAREPPPEEDYIKREQLRAIRRAVAKLPQPQQDVFILHTYGGLKFREIAQHYRRTESWARVTCYRAKQQILKEVSL